MVGKQVTGARLGIIGMGRVGRAFAAKARGFDMDVHYYNRSELPAISARSNLSCNGRKPAGCCRFLVAALPRNA